MASRATANQLALKLQGFRSALTNAEQQALDDLLQSFGRLAVQARRPAGRGLVFPRGGTKAIGDVKKAIPQLAASQPGPVAIGPTITTTTITTTIASHPIITCAKAIAART